MLLRMTMRRSGWILAIALVAVPLGARTAAGGTPQSAPQKTPAAERSRNGSHDDSHDLVPRQTMQGLLPDQAGVPGALARRRCLKLPAQAPKDRLIIPEGDKVLRAQCEVTSYQVLASNAPGTWFVARYRWTSLFTHKGAARSPEAQEKASEEEVVLFEAGAGKALRPIWHERFENDGDGILRSVTPELAQTARGAILLSVRRCLNGTGGCWQEFVERRGGHWSAVRQRWIAQLPAGMADGIRHGFRIGPRTLRGEAGFYSGRDPNCCPSQTLIFELALRNGVLVLRRYRLVPADDPPDARLRWPAASHPAADRSRRRAWLVLVAGEPSASGPVLRIPAKNPAEDNGEASAAAKQPSSTASPAAKSTELRLFAVVRDKKGRPVTGLTGKDFVLEADGRSRSGFQVSSANAFPLTVGIVAETLPGEGKEVAEERKHGAAFFEYLLRSGTDRGFLLRFDKQVELLQDVTSSQQKLAHGLRELAASGGRARKDSDSPARFFFGGNTLYDAIFLSADEVLRGWPGRRAIIVFSSGVDQESKVSLNRAIEAAQRAHVAIYCVRVPLRRSPRRSTEIGSPGGPRGYPGGYPRSPFPGGYPGGYPGSRGPFPGGGRRGPQTNRREKEARQVDGRRILRQIAQQTGGGYFDLKKEDTEKILTRIAGQLRQQYSVSFTAEATADGYHSLRLTTRRRKLRVQAPEGIYVQPGSVQPGSGTP